MGLAPEHGGPVPSPKTGLAPEHGRPVPVPFSEATEKWDWLPVVDARCLPHFSLHLAFLPTIRHLGATLDEFAKGTKP
jgi:hypothetical protein